MWKFLDFAITQILREINFEDPRSAKSAFLTDLQAVNLTFIHSCTFWNMKLSKLANFRALKMATGNFTPSTNLHSPRLISRKI